MSSHVFLRLDLCMFVPSKAIYICSLLVGASTNKPAPATFFFRCSCFGEYVLESHVETRNRTSTLHPSKQVALEVGQAPSLETDPTTHASKSVYATILDKRLTFGVATPYKDAWTRGLATLMKSYSTNPWVASMGQPSQNANV